MKPPDAFKNFKITLYFRMKAPTPLKEPSV